jgi:hypothetical protein
VRVGLDGWSGEYNLFSELRTCLLLLVLLVLLLLLEANVGLAGSSDGSGRGDETEGVVRVATCGKGKGDDCD